MIYFAVSLPFKVLGSVRVFKEINTFIQYGCGIRLIRSDSKDYNIDTKYVNDF